MDQVFSVAFGEGSHIWKTGLPFYFSHKDLCTFSSTFTDTSLFPDRIILAGGEGIVFPHLMHGESLPNTKTIKVES